MQQRLEEILKKKGIGPQGSKSLKDIELSELNDLFLQEEISLTTRCTLLLAILLLEKTPEENNWLLQFRQLQSNLNPALQFLLTPHSNTAQDRILFKLLQHHDLDEHESSIAIELLLDEEVPEHWKGCFLEGERLKRETKLENSVFLSQLWKYSDRIQTDLPFLLDIADNYDGFNRYRGYSPFLAAAIASTGVPVLLHGTHQVGPKFGITTHQLLSASGKKIPASLNESLKQLTEINWTYVDQSISFPALFRLERMRKEMVKRPFLATFEKLLQPIRAQNGNTIITGYTHPHYKEEVVYQLKNQQLCKNALVIKGLEGNPQLSLSHSCTVMHYTGSEVIEKNSFVDASCPISTDLMDKTKSIEAWVESGIDALSGKRNEAYYRISYMLMLLEECFPDHLKGLHSNVTEALNNGSAIESWKKFK